MKLRGNGVMIKSCAVKRLSVFTVVMIFAFSGSGNAFEVDGFRSGMSVKEALLIAQKFNPAAKAPDPTPFGTHVFIRPDGDWNSPKGWDLLFCQDRLVQLSKHYPFSWPAAAAIVSRLNLHYGEGFARSERSESFESEDTVEFSLPSSVGIKLFWENDQEWVSVRMALHKYHGKEQPKPQKTTGKEEIYEVYALQNETCIYGPAP